MEPIGTLPFFSKRNHFRLSLFGKRHTNIYWRMRGLKNMQFILLNFNTGKSKFYLSCEISLASFQQREVLLDENPLSQTCKCIKTSDCLRTAKSKYYKNIRTHIQLQILNQHHFLSHLSYLQFSRFITALLANGFIMWLTLSFHCWSRLKASSHLINNNIYYIKIEVVRTKVNGSHLSTSEQWWRTNERYGCWRDLFSFLANDN